MGFLVRRVLFAPFVFLAVAAITYLIPRGLRPDLYGDYPLLPGVGHDLERLVLHLDPGRACGLPGCPEIHDIWLRGMANDLYLLGGALVLGGAGGVALGRTLLVPWLVLGAPLGAMCLRMTIATVSETLDEDYVRSAIAKGLSPWRVLRKHAAPPSHVVTASLVGVSLPMMITNSVLVERVLSVPGFFRYTWKAVGHTEPPHRDYVMLTGLTLWGAVLIIGTSLLLDAAILWLDPRIRAAGRGLG